MTTSARRSNTGARRWTIQPNAAIENVYQRVQREYLQGDQSTERLYGMRVALRYEPNA